MKVFVEMEWTGGDRYYFRLTLPDGRNYRVSGDDWNRKTASAARDLLAVETGEERGRFRFDVK